MEISGNEAIYNVKLIWLFLILTYISKKKKELKEGKIFKLGEKWKKAMDIFVKKSHKLLWKKGDRIIDK